MAKRFNSRVRGTSNASVPVFPANRARSRGRGQLAGAVIQALESRRLLSGSLDTSFGSGGLVADDFSAPLDIGHSVMAVQSDGKYVVGTTVSTKSGAEFGLARYNADGTLDTTFNGTGYVRTPVDPSGAAYLASIAIAPDGTIVAAGDSAPGEINLVCYNANGSLDTGFNGTGTLEFRFSGANSTATAVAIDTSATDGFAGDIVLGGFTTVGSITEFAAARLTPAGALDAAFNGTGQQTVDFTQGSTSAAESVAIDSQGRIILAGYVTIGSADRFAVARLSANGDLDTSFEGGSSTVAGESIASFGSGVSADAFAVAVDSSFDIVAAGSASGTSDMAVLRLNSDGSVDTGFEGGDSTTPGEALINFGTNLGIAATANAVTFDAAGGVVLGGSADIGGQSVIAVARLSSTGALDSSFNGGSAGEATVQFGTDDSEAFSVAIDGSDNVIAAGTASNSSLLTSDIAIARIADTGIPDTTFNSTGRLETPFLGLTDLTGAQTAVQTNGSNADRIIVAYTVPTAGGTELGVSRFNSDGSLDTSVGAGGSEIISVGSGVTATLAGLTVAPGGNIVLVGNDSAGNVDVVELSPNGTPVGTFGTAGIASFSLGGIASSVAVDTGATDIYNGDIVVGGSAQDPDNYYDDMAVARLTATGVLDSTFNGTGIETVDFGSQSLGYADAVDSAGDVVVGGVGPSLSYYDDMSYAKISAGGAVTTGGFDFGDEAAANAVTFDSAGDIVLAGAAFNDTQGYDEYAVAVVTRTGSSTASFDLGTEAVAHAVTVDSSGNIILAGTTDPGFSGAPYDLTQIALLEITSSLAPNTAFGTNGIVTTSFTGTSGDSANSIGIDDAGRLVVGGNTIQSGTGAELALARYTDTTTVTTINTSLTVSPATGTYGGSVTLSASVGAASGPAVNSGSVTFTILNGSTPVGAVVVPVSGGSASTSFSLSGLDAGGYTIDASDADTSGTYNPSNGSAGLAVTQATPTINLTTPSGVIYDGHAHGATATVTGINSTSLGSATLTYYAGPTATGTPLGSAPTNAGQYTVVASYSSIDYALTTTQATYNIAQAALLITANNAARAYGAADPTFSVSYHGFVNSENQSVLTSLPTVTPTATATSGVGNYALTASGAMAANYAISYAPGTEQIIAATLTVAVNNANRTYGAANPSFSSTVSGLVNGNTISIAYSTPATTGSGVGNYAINATVTAAPGVLANYNLAVTPGTLQVTQAALTISAKNAHRTYGAANPSFSVSYSGFVNGDTSAVLTSSPVESTSATTSSNVGTYAINVSGAAAANYAITYVSGTLTVNKAALTVIVNPTARRTGQPNPAFTVTYLGFVLGQNSSVLGGTLSFSTSATQSSPIGIYTVNASGLTSGNYAITYIPGLLLVY
jgi:uncharacterized delta-60 repeat protein